MRIRRQEDGFNLSFLDVMACGLGAVILILILVDFNAFDVTPSEEQQRLEVELAQAQQQSMDLTQRLAQMRAQLDALRMQQQQLQQSKQANSSEQQTLLAQISQQMAVVAALEQQAAAMAPVVTPDANIALSGTGEQQYITGLRVEGKDMGILLDVSASMMGNSLVEVLGMLRLAPEKKKTTPKWQRIERVLTWLLARVPETSRLSVIAFSEKASLLGAPRVLPQPDKLADIQTGFKALVPEGGTNLQTGLNALKAAHPALTDIYLITDGLPTLGDGLPLNCRNIISSSKTISSACRQSLMVETIKRTPPGVRVHVILLPIEGDPYAASMYWLWTSQTGGTFLAPSGDWP